MRREHDAYYTPSSAIDDLKRFWKPEKGRLLVEPCVGERAIVKGFDGRAWLTNDINWDLEAESHFDATQDPFWISAASIALEKTCKTPICVTNPPFNQAVNILQHAFYRCHSVAFLLRLSFLEPTKHRGPFLRSHPPDLVIVLPRISFTGDGKTDSVTCAWMIWDSSIIFKGIRVA